MIFRNVEYGVQCDNEDCHKSVVWGATTRAQALEEAPEQGFVRCTRGRWLCDRCAAKLLPAEKVGVENPSK